MDKSNRYLTESNHRYAVAPDGRVYEGGRLLNTHNGCVMLDWVLGHREYNVASLLVVVYGEIKIPLTLFDEIEPLYLDGDQTNVCIQNVIYRFRNGPLEVPDLPGFYYVPFYTNYCINETGTLLTINSLRVKSWAITKPGRKNSKGGYRYSRVLTDLKKSVCLFMHRALCLVFKKYGNDLPKLIPNHLDGIPENNGLINLEWSTYSENNQHAHDNELRPNSTFPVLVRNIDTGEIHRYPSMVAAGKGVGVSTMVVYWRIRKTPSRVFKDRLQFKIDDGLPWVKPDLKICRVGVGGDIVAINIFSREKILFTGCGSGEKLTGVKSGTILYHVRNKPPIPIGGFVFRYLEDAKSIPHYSERHLKIFARYPMKPPKGIIVTDIRNGVEMFFESSQLAATHYGLPKRLICELANKNGLLKEIYRVSYFDPYIV